MTYQDQLKDPRGKIFWGKRKLQSVQWSMRDQIGTIKIRIRYALTMPIERKEMKKRIFTAVIIKAKDAGYHKNIDILQKCSMHCSLDYRSYFCILTIITHDYNVYNYFNDAYTKQHFS